MDPVYPCPRQFKGMLRFHITIGAGGP